MRHFLQSIILLFIIHTTATSQQIVSVVEKGKFTKEQIISTFNVPLIKFGATYYKVTYTSVDAKGEPDILSGLLLVPDDVNFKYPALVYQHGTSDCKTCVPSRLGSSGGDEGKIGLLFAGMGFVSILPDLVGMGDSRGFQTYVQASTTMSATEHMVQAVRSWAPDHGIAMNDQLFITGYSQGGYSSMVFQEGMQNKFGASSVTAAAHMSGPYSLSGTMRDLILSNDIYLVPAFIVTTALGMNEVYGIFNKADEFFKAEYVSDIEDYYDNKIGLSDLNTKLSQKLVAFSGALVIKNLFKEEVLNAIQNDPNYIVNRILRENDAYKWTPKSPTRIFYCKADELVSYKNSIVARDSMYARGASEPTLVVTDVDSKGTHGTCVTPALTQSLFFFLGYQKISTSVNNVLVGSNIRVYPNPAADRVIIETPDDTPVDVSVWDMDATERITMKQINGAVKEVNVSSLESGMYIIALKNTNGEITTKKLIIQK